MMYTAQNSKRRRERARRKKNKNQEPKEKKKKVRLQSNYFSCGGGLFSCSCYFFFFFFLLFLGNKIGRSIQPTVFLNYYIFYYGKGWFIQQACAIWSYYKGIRDTRPSLMVKLTKIWRDLTSSFIFCFIFSFFCVVQILFNWEYSFIIGTSCF